MVCVFARKTSEPLASLVEQIDKNIGENGKLNSFVVIVPKKRAITLRMGFDSQMSAFLVETTGRVRGIDMSPEMLNIASAGLEDHGLLDVEFIEGRAEDLPMQYAWANDHNRTTSGPRLLMSQWPCSMGAQC